MITYTFESAKATFSRWVPSPAFAVLLACGMAACPPSPVSPPNDASDASPAPIDDASDADAEPDGRRRDRYDAACAQLKALGCKEGAASNCAATMRSADGKLVDLMPACVTAAKSVQAVRACGAAWTKGCTP